MCVPQKQLADMLTTGVFTTIPWRSLLRLFDIHLPSNVNLDRSLSESSSSAVSPQNPSRNVESLQLSLSATFDGGLWEEKPGYFSHGVRSALEQFQGKHNLVPQAPLGEAQFARRNEEAQNPTFFFWRDVCRATKLKGESVTKKAYIEAMWKSFGKTTLFAAMEHRYPNVQFIMDALAGSLVVSTAEGDFLLEGDHFESVTTGKVALVSPIESVLTKIHDAKAYVFSESSSVSLGASLIWKASGTLEDRWMENRKEGGSNTSKCINAKILESEFNFNPSFTSAQLLATIKQHVSSAINDFGHQKILGVTTSGKPKVRTATRTEKPRIFSQNTTSPDTRSLFAPQFSSREPSTKKAEKITSASTRGGSSSA